MTDGVTMQNILVIGGAGYVGAVLVPKLLDQGYAVRVLDLMLFGEDVLPRHPKLDVIKGDMRDKDVLAAANKNMDAVIQLACISNDPSFELDPELSKSINFDAIEPTVAFAREFGASRYVYASTSSVYGVSEAPEVTEDHPLIPLTDYNKYKGLSEPHVLKYQSDDFTPVIIRPATVCGYSPRLRLDLTVNILTAKAVTTKEVTVFGGSQKRPNIHVDDIAELYIDLLTRPKEQISGETFNAAYENHTVAQLAEIVRSTVMREMPDLGEISITTTPSNDLRSYHVSSAKIKNKLGWEPKRTIDDAVVGLCQAFKDGRIPMDALADTKYINVKTVQAAGLK
ncbi:MAG: SDR family oxidoreductase [Chloroflexi bacterium]|nr:SDR family oxidoreductase [Chloroflexota bacterium]